MWVTMLLLPFRLAREHTLKMGFMGSIYGFPNNAMKTNCEHLVPRSRFEGIFELNNDMLNLFPCCPIENCRRSNKALGEHKDKSHYVPPVESRGIIARTCIRIIDKYPHSSEVIRRHVLTFDMIEKWDFLYKEDENEMRRLEIIERLQRYT